MKDVSYVPNANFNLFSVTRRMQNGWTLSGDKNAIILTKDGRTITFDILIKTKKGALYCVYFKRNGREEFGNAQVTMSVNKAHELLGHPSEAHT